METSSGDVMVDALPWELLTDGILLVIMSFLDAKSLVCAAQTCKHWYRVAHDNSLWKDLVMNKVSSKDLQERVLAKAEEEHKQGKPLSHGTWKEEYIRMEDEAPLILSETLEGHTDEIYHINFSTSGNLFSTTGRDASVRVWKFGYPCTLYSENTDLDSILVYTRFSDFNQSETLLLVGGIASYIMGADSCTLILSVKGLEILYAVSGSNANFRGCWLDDTSFLNGTHIYTPSGHRRFLIKKHTVTERRKSDQKIQILISKMDAKGQQIMILQPFSRNNDFARIAYLPTRCLQQPTTPSSHTMSPFSEQFEYIDSEQPDEKSEATVRSDCVGVRPGSSQDSVASCSINEDMSPVLILANNTEEYPSTGFLSFYRVPEITEKNAEQCKNFGSAGADHPGGLVGMRLSTDNRYVAFNYRNCTMEGGEYDHGCYVKNIDLKVFDLHNMCFTDLVYKGHLATSEDHLSYIFPAVSDHYIASGSEVEKGYLWDRHFGNILGELEHAAQPGNGGVNAAVFHPHSEEVLITVGDDRKIKLWRSKRLLRELGHNDIPVSVFNQNSHKNTEQYKGHDKSSSKGGLSKFDPGVDQLDNFIDDEVVTCCMMKRKPGKTKMCF